MLKRILLIFFVFSSISIIECNKNNNDLDVDERMIKYVKVWFDKMEKTRKMIKKKTEEGFLKAEANFTLFDAKLSAAKQSNSLMVEMWVDKNCPILEQGNFNTTIVDECFNDDQKIQNITLQFTNYMGCIMQLMFELKLFNQALDSHFKSYKKQVLLIEQKNIEQKDYHNILNTLYVSMNAVRDLIQKQLSLLKDFSYQEHQIELTEQHYDEYYSIKGRTVTKTVHNFVSKCYDLFTFANLEELSSHTIFASFRKCIVRKTCNENIYQQFNPMAKSVL